MKGYHQRLLIVDVSRQTFEIETLSEELLRTCIGGKGLAVHLLLRCNRPRVDPLGPDNHLGLLPARCLLQVTADRVSLRIVFRGDCCRVYVQGRLRCSHDPRHRKPAHLD